ncbi:MAG: hypothetical protein EOO13_07145 [Chitinophagaceae bacterium]|nr:MAG: hypothetical protein EOO13_07145 [Chitinophagaceae bacterium]
MKKVITYTMLLAFPMATLLSCGISKKSNKGILGGTNVGGTVVKTVATVVGLILLSKLLKSVLGTIGGSSSFASLSQNPDFSQNFNEHTPLKSFASTELMQTALQVLVAEKYKIPFSSVRSNYARLNTAGDLATFIGQNADAKILEGIK